MGAQEGVLNALKIGVGAYTGNIQRRKASDEKMLSDNMAEMRDRNMAKYRHGLLEDSAEAASGRATTEAERAEGIRETQAISREERAIGYAEEAVTAAEKKEVAQRLTDLEADLRSGNVSQEEYEFKKEQIEARVSPEKYSETPAKELSAEAIKDIADSAKILGGDDPEKTIAIYELLVAAKQSPKIGSLLSKFKTDAEKVEAAQIVTDTTKEVSGDIVDMDKKQVKAFIRETKKLPDGPQKVTALELADAKLKTFAKTTGKEKVTSMLKKAARYTPQGQAIGNVMAIPEAVGKASRWWQTGSSEEVPEVDYGGKR